MKGKVFMDRGWANITNSYAIKIRCGECGTKLDGAFYSGMERGGYDVVIQPCPKCTNTELVLDESRINDIMNICLSILNE